jgi:hypothetical protein
MEAASSRLVGEGIPKDSSSGELLAWITGRGDGLEEATLYPCQN